MRKRAWIPVVVLALLCVAMSFIPSPFPLAHDFGSSCRARVVSVDNSQLTLTGLIEYGTQHLEVELLDGPFAGQTRHAENELRAQLELDKKFVPGDTALVTIPTSQPPQPPQLSQPPQPPQPPQPSLIARDHWRLGWMAVLFAAFCVLLIAFGGMTGAKALFSFVFSCFAVWKLLIPLCLNGWHAGWTSFACVTMLTAVIMYLVAGATRKGLAAFVGAMLGVAVSLALAEFFASALHVTGATMPFVQSLLYSGYESLDLADVFTGAVILASSGAVMDLAMDIAAGVDEVKRHNAALGFRDLMMSGIRIGRSVVGTMTTTLLLAYSGGYLTLLMVFAAQGTSPVDFLNSTVVSAEVVKTLVGSFGLVLVAPFTAVVSAYVYTLLPVAISKPVDAVSHRVKKGVKHLLFDAERLRVHKRGKVLKLSHQSTTASDVRLKT